ncbi:DNA polymerase IV [Methanosarcina mazei]|nr:DNA polymerase IV [Methanosarcina mazei]
MLALNQPTNNTKRQIVLHVDMDSFFASVEVREHPELKGLPVVVGSDPKGGKGRGVVSTCSYEARKYGIHSAMPVSQAYKLCPDAAFVPVNMKLYAQVSGNVMEIMKGFAEKFQQYSVDEAFLVPVAISNFEEAAIIGLRIKDEILKHERITCSVGVGPNKLVAKVASKFQKPDGLTVIRPEDVQELLYPLDVSKIPGIGGKTTEALKLMGITKVEELANCDVQRLSERFGKMGLWMKQVSQGLDFNEVKEREEAVKSISRSGTFAEDTSDPVKIAGFLELLAESVHRALMRDGFLFKIVTLRVRFEDFSTYSRSKTVSVWTSDIFVIKRVSMQLLAEFIGKQKIRLVGVGVSRLRERDERQTMITEF